MAVAEGTILRVVLQILFPDSSLMQNIFYCILTTAGGSDDDEDVVSDMNDWLEEILGNFNAQLFDTLGGGETVVYEYDTVGEDWDEVGGEVINLGAASAEDMLPHGVAFNIQGNCLDPDVRGRKYFGGFCENNQTDGTWNTSITVPMLAAGADWITAFVGAATGATFTPGVWSPTQVAFKPFSNVIIISNVPAYQRRRKPGVGV